jgi:ATP-binding cassette subfamily B protein RaxB
MILNFHGHLIDIATLRQRFTFSLKGVTLAQLMGIARQVHLDTRPLRVELEHLHEVEAPCILHWNMSHFVVLKEVRNGRLIIHDPSFGVRNVTFAEASERFTGVALELTPASSFVAHSELRKISLRDVLGPVRGATGALTYLFLFASFLECIVIAFPLGIQWVIDAVLVTSDHNLLATVAIGFVLLVCFQSFLTVIRAWASLYFSTSMNVQWISRIFDHMLHIRLDFFERRYLGDLISRFEAANSIQRTLSTNLIETLVDGLIGLGVVVVLFVYNVEIGLVSVCGVVLYAIVKHGLLRRARIATDEAITRQARQQGFLIETLRGIRAIKLGAREQVRSTMWSTLVASYTNARLVSDKLSIVS